MEVIVCPSCKGRLLYDQQGQALICLPDKFSFPVMQGAPRFFNGYSETLQGKEY
jgi:uncharacterized protein